jgi:hypothetical protein
MENLPIFFKNRYCSIQAIAVSLLAILFINATAYSQSSEWWAQNVGWDGVRPAHYYLNLSSAKMGPNALPVPEMHRLLADSSSWFYAGAQGAFTQGEQTVASLLAMQWRANKWFRLGIKVIPLEWYQTSHEIKTERKIFYQSYDNSWAGGDIYAESFIRLPDTWLKGISSELRMGIKTASGTNLGAARYTDTPGYYADFAFSKSINAKHQWEAMIGFYAYQTYDDQLRQNDCLLWGLGHHYHNGHLLLMQSLRGYMGYLGNGDIPIVYDLEARWKPRNSWSWQLKMSRGLHDYPFTLLTVGGLWHFDLPVE